jgi:predicted ester cyclase
MLTEQQCREMLQRLLDTLNTSDWDAMDSVMDDILIDDYVWHVAGLPDPVRGLQASKETMRAGIGSIPGYRATIEDVICDGNKVAYRFRLHTTDPDTGAGQHTVCLMLLHIEGDRFTEEWILSGPWEDDKE